jgi:two-component system chemotaxis response regulator CheY
MTRVLIVDDSALTREFHSHIVKDAGFACVTAVDGMDGLEKATAQKFDLILTDINMQGMDGYEFIRRVRQNPDYDGVPIIIISTEGREFDKQQGFNAGANLYLVKPTDAHRIVESMRMLLGTREDGSPP